MLKAGNKSLYLALFLFVTGAIFFPAATLGEISVDFQLFHKLMEKRFGADRVGISQAWERMLAETDGLSEQQKLSRVSRFFHRHLRHETDLNLWGIYDYWATPLETMGMGKGDCEDWVIAKYLSLRLAGLEDRTLRLIYVSARINTRRGPTAEQHMVLGYYAHPRAEPLILDSLTPRILPASRRDDLTPVFSFNGEGLWVGSMRASAESGSIAPMSNWRDVLDRIQQEGYNWSVPKETRRAS